MLSQSFHNEFVCFISPSLILRPAREAHQTKVDAGKVRNDKQGGMATSVCVCAVDVCVPPVYRRRANQGTGQIRGEI